MAFIHKSIPENEDIKALFDQVLCKPKTTTTGNHGKKLISPEANLNSK